MRGWIRTTVSAGAAVALALGATGTPTAQAAPTFAPTTTAAAHRPLGLGVGDFNGDGLRDNAVANDDTTSFVLRRK